MSEKSWLCRHSVFGLLCIAGILQSQLFLVPQATRAKLVRIRAYSFHCGITWYYWYRNQKEEKNFRQITMCQKYIRFFMFLKISSLNWFWGSFRSDSQTSSVWRILKVSQYKFKISLVRKSADLCRALLLAFYRLNGESRRHLPFGLFAGCDLTRFSDESGLHGKSETFNFPFFRD